MRVGSIRLPAYVLLRAAVGVGAALAIVAAIVLLIEFVDLARSVGGRAEVDFVDLASLALLKAPIIVVQLFAFVFLFGSLAAFAALNRRGELIALRAAGMSAWTFVGPCALGAGAFGVIVVAALHPITARLNETFDEKKAALTEGRAARASSDIWLRQADAGGEVIIHARAHEARGDAIRLRGVSMFVQAIRPAGGLVFSRRIEAAEARLTPGSWRLTDVREVAPGAELERSEQLSIPSTLDRTTAMEKFVSPLAVPFWRLPRTIRAAKAAGYSAARYEVRLQQWLATPFLLGGMTLLAATFSLRLTRLGRLPVLAVLGVASGFVVFFINSLCGALGSAEVLPPLVAAWSPPLLTVCFGAAVLCYTEDG